ncbi:hypothetical protein NQ176_g10757 [Zarea fungicola]|uniref:Uncharacterized protein n=1 Tax=Zarea fungicola TaxID=93591 RepID=A0ACC1MFW6_9HYPO|nr:hypothetical protein NQ176_g10757 [Lecanicillium fungicola]
MRVPQDVTWDKEVIYHAGAGPGRIGSILMTPLATGVGRVSSHVWAAQLLLALRHFDQAIRNPAEFSALEVGRILSLDEEIQATRHSCPEVLASVFSPRTFYLLTKSFRAKLSLTTLYETKTDQRLSSCALPAEVSPQKAILVVGSGPDAIIADASLTHCQKQLLCPARALLHGHADIGVGKIVLLDEATAPPRQTETERTMAAVTKKLSVHTLAGLINDDGKLCL